MQTLGQYPMKRMRRMRHDDFSRRLMRENVLTANDLILPVFVKEGEHDREAIPTMPGVVRYTVDELVAECEKMVELGIPMVALFPHIEDNLKTPDGIEAANPEGLIPRTVKAIKAACPDLGIMCDVALDPYTTHGQDGLIDETGYILNDETIEMLVKQAMAQAEAGADVVAPSSSAALWTRSTSSTHASWRIPQSTLPPTTAPSATPWVRALTWVNPPRPFTSRIPPTATKPSGKWVLTWKKAPTWSW